MHEARSPMHEARSPMLHMSTCRHPMPMPMSEHAPVARKKDAAARASLAHRAGCRRREISASRDCRRGRASPGPGASPGMVRTGEEIPGPLRSCDPSARASGPRPRTTDNGRRTTGHGYERTAGTREEGKASKGAAALLAPPRAAFCLVRTSYSYFLCLFSVSISIRASYRWRPQGPRWPCRPRVQLRHCHGARRCAPGSPAAARYPRRMHGREGLGGGKDTKLAQSPPNPNTRRSAADSGRPPSPGPAGGSPSPFYLVIWFFD